MAIERPKPWNSDLDSEHRTAEPFRNGYDSSVLSLEAEDKKGVRETPSAWKASPRHPQRESKLLSTEWDSDPKQRGEQCHCIVSERGYLYEQEEVRVTPCTVSNRLSRDTLRSAVF